MSAETPQAAASLALTIRAWITANPGRHRPNEVAEALSSSGVRWGALAQRMDDAKWRQRVANEMARMYRAGILERGRISDNQSGPGVFYWVAKNAPSLERHTLASEQLVCSCGVGVDSRDGFKAHQRQANMPASKKRKKK